ncbi:hypothetical protein [Pseudomonas huanghezhanensis]|nr:hypothetical protein [Pseudomonas sp. BSw22131]
MKLNAGIMLALSVRPALGLPRRFFVLNAYSLAQLCRYVEQEF